MLLKTKWTLICTFAVTLLSAPALANDTCLILFKPVAPQPTESYRDPGTLGIVREHYQRVHRSINRADNFIINKSRATFSEWGTFYAYDHQGNVIQFVPFWSKRYGGISGGASKGALASLLDYLRSSGYLFNGTVKGIGFSHTHPMEFTNAFFSEGDFMATDMFRELLNQEGLSGIEFETSILFRNYVFPIVMSKNTFRVP